MQKDITQKELEGYNDVFADIYNELIFGGKQVLREEDLIALPTESFTRNTDGTVHQGLRDVRKADKRNGEYRLIWCIENQSGTDNTMPERIMGYEYAAYEEQIKALMAENKKKNISAVTRRLHAHQKLAPVVTVVMNWSEEEWTGPRCLHDMLEFPEELEEELRPLVSDYSFHLIEMARLPEEVRRRFRSDFRILAEYAATRKEPEKWEEFLQTDSLRMLHPEEVLDALKAVSGDIRYGQIMNQLTKREKEEGVKMCVVAEKLERIGIEKGMQEGHRRGVQEGRRQGMQEGRLRGMQEGIHQNMLQVICNMLRKNRSEEEILELTECSREVLEEARALLQDEC